MKALVKAAAEPGLWMQDVPEPSPGPRDVKIRVHKTSICGTDLHIRHWDAWAQATIPVPMVVGHAFVGVVVDGGTPTTSPQERIAAARELRLGRVGRVVEARVQHAGVAAGRMLREALLLVEDDDRGSWMSSEPRVSESQADDASPDDGDVIPAHASTLERVAL